MQQNTRCTEVHNVSKLPELIGSWGVERVGISTLHLSDSLALFTPLTPLLLVPVEQTLQLTNMTLPRRADPLRLHDPLGIDEKQSSDAAHGHGQQYEAQPPCSVLPLGDHSWQHVVHTSSIITDILKISAGLTYFGALSTYQSRCPNPLYKCTIYYSLYITHVPITITDWNLTKCLGTTCNY